MNKRIVKVDLNIDGLRVVRISDATQHDKSTHFIGISFMDNVELAGYALQVYYLPPFPATIPFVDTFENLQSSMEIPIPDRVLERNGEVTVEFVLSKDKELLTINQNFSFEVIKTINGTSLTAYPEGTLKETIAQQIEKIKGLLADTDTKIEEYDNNATEKTQSFNDNAAEKLKAYNDNDVSKTTAYNQNANEKLETYNDNSNSKTSDFNENAERKTAEFDTHVKNTTDNAYVEMDKKATEYANIAGERANKAVIEQGNVALRAIREEGSGQVGAVGNAGSTAVQEVANEGEKQAGLVADAGAEEIKKIETAGTQAVSDINANKDAHVKAVTDEGNKQVLAVGNKGTEEVSKVQSAGAKAVEDVNANKTANIQAITEEGTKQTGLVADKGAEQIKLVRDEGTKQATAVENKGTEQISLVTAEGNKQLILTQAEAIKVIEQLKSLIAGNPDTSNAQALSGKSRIEFERDTQALAGKYAGNFPLTSAVKDAVYLVPATGKFYVCTQAYNGSNLTAPNANFEEMSVWANRDKLGNLFEFGSNKNVNYFKTNGIVIQWLTTNLSPNQAIESGGLIKLKLPISIKHGYSTSISRQYNNHPLSEGYYTCVPVNTNEIGILLDEFRNSLDKIDVYYITIIGSPLS